MSKLSNDQSNRFFDKFRHPGAGRDPGAYMIFRSVTMDSGIRRNDDKTQAELHRESSCQMSPRRTEGLRNVYCTAVTQYQAPILSAGLPAAFGTYFWILRQRLITLCAT